MTKRNSLIILTILSVSLIIFYWRSFNNFFFQDDFFCLKLAQEYGLLDAFNLFKKPIVDFYLYRPFSIQLYWLIGYKMFGFLPQGYHLINFLFFLLSVFLVYKLALQIKFNEKSALLASFFYAYSSSHFYRLFWITNFQELSLAVFTFGTLILFLKKSPWTPLLFILALTSKETAVMIVPFMLLTIFLTRRVEKDYFILFFYCLAILLFYLFARIVFFGFAGGEAYAFDFGIKKILNNFFWYSLWSLGLPEAFVNVKFFQLPTVINPKLFTQFNSWGNPTLIFFGLFLLLVFKPVVDLRKKVNEKVLLAVSCFILFLLPVAFFPFHKFPYSLSVPLLGSSLLLAYAVSSLRKKQLIIICISYILLSVAAYQFNLLDHWSIKKANIAKAVFNYFEKKYPKKPINANIYFRNTCAPLCQPKKVWSPSQDVAYAIAEMNGLRLLYNDKNLLVYFEDIDADRHLLPNSLILDSRKFLGY